MILIHWRPLFLSILFIGSLNTLSLNAWSRGGGGCFLPDTPILRADGSSVAISRIHPGDIVQAYNPDGTLNNSKVHAVLKHQVDTYYVVSTKTLTINVTGEHPFYIGNGLFKTVKALHRGNLIYVFDGKQLKPEPISQINSIKAVTMVYNLQTDEPHTYFAAGVAVHNKGEGSGGCFPKGTKILTPKGIKPIELLMPGEQVISLNRKGQEVINRVQSTYATRSSIVSIVTDWGTLHTTEEHPIALRSGVFMPAGQLKVGDFILFKNKKSMQPVRIKSLYKGSEQIVFNLSVQSPHTYLAEGFLVHNKGGSGFGGSSNGHSSDESIIVFILILVGYAIISLIKDKKNKNEHLDYNYSPKVIQRKSLKTLKLIQFIATQDSTMKPASLEKLVRDRFMLLQDCWMKRNYEPMKALLMPDLYRQHSMQLTGMIRNQEINRLDWLAISAIDLVNIRYTENKEQREFTALITVSACDYYLDEQTMDFLRGDTETQLFQEFWTFQFHHSQWLLREIEQTRESDYLEEENFFEQFTDAQIEKIYQDKIDNLGVAGPGLAKVIQDKANKVDRMLNFLVQSDIIWNKHSMLNRVRLIFTDVHLALQAGELNLETQAELYPIVAEQFNQTVARWKAAGKAIEYRNFCVRKVEILLVYSFEDKAKNEFTARISAHAQRIQKQDGIILTQDNDVTFFKEYWTFGLLNNQWKLKEAVPQAQGAKVIYSENQEESSSPDLVKWYYTKKRAL